MPQNMSFMLTTPQIRQRIKTVTRRIGWASLKPGATLIAVEKGQGLKKGQKAVRLCRLRVVSVKRERLRRLIDDPAYGWQEVVKEGFSGMAPADFIKMFCQANKKTTPDSTITRIEFGYLD